MHIPLSFPHPRTWVETSPARRWNRKARTWVHRPKTKNGLRDWYTADLLRALDGHALRWLNVRGGPDHDSLASLSIDLRNHAIAAGKRVGVRFTPGPSTASRVLGGDLSLDWLTNAAGQAAAFALEHWDHAYGEWRHERAVTGGKGSHLKLTPADLLPLAGLSASKQAEKLGCSVRKVKYLRADLAREQGSNT